MTITTQYLLDLLFSWHISMQDYGISLEFRFYIIRSLRPMTSPPLGNRPPNRAFWIDPFFAPQSSKSSFYAKHQPMHRPSAVSSDAAKPKGFAIFPSRIAVVESAASTGCKQNEACDSSHTISFLLLKGQACNCHQLI